MRLHICVDAEEGASSGDIKELLTHGAQFMALVIEQEGFWSGSAVCFSGKSKKVLGKISWTTDDELEEAHKSAERN